MIDCSRCMLLDWFATCKLVHGVMQGLCCCRGVLVPLCVGACVSKHGSLLVECVNARLLLRHIKCNGFFGNVSTSICGVDPIIVCKPLKLVKGHISTRLETRTKESNACVSFRVVKLLCVLKDIVGISSPATNQAIV